MTRTEIMAILWPDTAVEEGNLSFQISTLRKALGPEGSKWVETVPRHGYRFRTLEAVEPPPVAPVRQGSKQLIWMAIAAALVAVRNRPGPPPGTGGTGSIGSIDHIPRL